MKSWEELDVDGRRINRIIRILETKLKKSKSDEKTVRYANAIGFLTSKKIEVLKIHHDIEGILKHIEEQKKMRKSFS